MIKTFFIAIFAAVLLAGCNNQAEEIINFEDLIPSSERYSELDNEEGEAAVEDSMSLIIKRFTDVGIDVVSAEYNSQNIFPDRFGPVQNEKIRLISATDTLNYFKWIYSDSTKVMNAFFNWMDCYGKKCKSIFIGEEKNIQKSPLLIFVNDTALVFIESTSNIDIDKWEDYHKHIGYESDWSFQLEQKRWGKLSWFTYIEEDKTPYYNEDSQ